MHWLNHVSRPLALHFFAFCLSLNLQSTSVFGQSLFFTTYKYPYAIEFPRNVHAAKHGPVHLVTKMYFLTRASDYRGHFIKVGYTGSDKLKIPTVERPISKDNPKGDKSNPGLCYLTNRQNIINEIARNPQLRKTAQSLAPGDEWFRLKVPEHEDQALGLYCTSHSSIQEWYDPLPVGPEVRCWIDDTPGTEIQFSLFCQSNLALFCQNPLANWNSNPPLVELPDACKNVKRQ
ncbi:hypothetical protein BCR37DRAFT_377579 [Protomyces lactucae-debilis]|uniref:Uncharacterized protein n=1 Tax=Protomyces lactucae-debilis TaxID=2754530 RepID=A0A1Y2FLC9_PROLT|nr:uncharacterized protein BCR37DRAFT_377579 [Protomyces lactucae-debilis]ORY84802.1 hypothetical protein BCR37DRAFT_377579 [Protomyces lactucae-debilis]